MLPELDDERSPRRSGEESEYSFSTAITPRRVRLVFQVGMRHAVHHVYDEYML